MAQNKAKESKGRGRPRAYNPEEALGQALGVFWNTGFSAASLDSIASAAGMNRPSLYAAFGDKHALYLKALGHYWSQAAAAMDAALGDDGLTLRQALTQFYQGQLGIYFSGEGQPRGCFMIGTAATEAIEDAEIKAFLLEGMGKLDAFLTGRIQAAIDAGELGQEASAATLAMLASSVLHSISIRARAGQSRAELTEIADGAVKMICG